MAGFDPLAELPDRVRVVIEVPRGGIIKHDPQGAVDVWSPLPCPYNYGCVPARPSTDGAPLDALVLGSRLRRGTAVDVPVRGVVRFLDAGEFDPKLVCSTAPLTRSQRRGVILFFTVYAAFKRWLQARRRKGGSTRYDGFVAWPPVRR